MTRLISTFGFLGHTPRTISTRGFFGMRIPPEPAIPGVISRQRGTFAFHKNDDTKNFKISIRQRKR